ncbi:Aladin [Camellia lanceoleosa]|uniref:Aladin n=1 Tax=Camellia lanceoleosa TaxID=1840588 RepID=A0ACC0FVG1_9ERIC|nr:Aladin [Camellia lanceoleosa]
MYSFPRPVTAENLSDDRAKETYAKVLGIVFRAVSFRTDHLLPSPNPEQGSEQLGRIDESVQRNIWGRICIWTASYPGNAASVRSGVTSGTIARGTGTRWTLVDFLRSHDDEQISALSWSPDGRYPN